MTAVVVAGGGPAGAAAACRLAKGGRAVMVLEREKAAAHKVCGEFLSGEALAELAELGIDVTAMGAAPIAVVRLVHRGRAAEGRLPFAAAGLSRRVLDEALLRRAAELGAQVHRGVRVRSAAQGSLETDGGSLQAPALLLATGKHELRGLARPIRVEPEPLIGFKMHLRLRRNQGSYLAGHVEVILFRGGYAGLQLIEGGIANLCLLVNRARYDEHGQDWHSLLAALQEEESHLARRLEGSASCWQYPLSIFRVPYGFVHRGPEQGGVYRLGDQAAVIPSFCGDGIAIALHSAKLAAASILARDTAAQYHRAVRQAASRPVRLAFGLYRLSRSSMVRAAIVRGARVWPGLLTTVAARTRVATP